MTCTHPLLQPLGQGLQALLAGNLRPAELSALARAQQDLLNALPPRYATVLADLLDRLEAGALFAEESCSFSQQELLDGLQQWVAQAQRRLEGA